MDDQTYKKDAGKLPLSLVPVEGIRSVARVREFGIRKYKDKKGYLKLDPQRLIDALYRHLLTVVEKGLFAKDEESELYAIEHVACNALMLCQKLRELLQKDSGEKE